MSTFSAWVTNASISSTTNDIMTLVPATSGGSGGSGRRVWLTEIAVMGMGTSSAASEVAAFQVTTAGATGGGAITPTPWDFYSSAAGSSVFTTWTTQPVVGTALVRLSVNANGGIYRWVARPGQELNAIGGLAKNMEISIRTTVSGGGNYTVGITWIEDPI